KEQGVETLVHWPKPIWEHQGLGLAASDVPKTLSICREVLSLPLSAETTEAQVQTIVASLQAFFSKHT
nr:DegT/DnrJ/EryC1/StrS family aminotransferase [Nitrospira sp.]